MEPPTNEWFPSRSLITIAIRPFFRVFTQPLDKPGSLFFEPPLPAIILTVLVHSHEVLWYDDFPFASIAEIFLLSDRLSLCG